MQQGNLEERSYNDSKLSLSVQTGHAGRSDHQQINWSQIYENRCYAASCRRQLAERRTQIKKMELTSKTKGTGFMNQERRAEFVDQVVHPEPWKEIWGRNLKCEDCSRLVMPGSGRLVCYLCPAVQHRRNCLSGIESSVQFSGVEVDPLWICGECKDTLADDIGRRKDQSLRFGALKYLRKKSIIQIQKTARMYLIRNNFKRCVVSIQKTQAAIRGVVVRNMFRSRYGKRFRPIEISVMSSNFESTLSAKGTKGAKVRVIVTLINDDKSNLSKYGRNEFGNDTKDASNVSMLDNQKNINQESVSSVFAASWEQEAGVVFVPCTHSFVRVVFTVVFVSSCPQKGSESIAAVDFIGQVSTGLHDSILYSRSIRNKTLSLGSCKTPVELSNGKDSNETRINGLWGAPAMGELEFQVTPRSHVTSQCGYVVEVSSTQASHKPLKKWFLIIDGSTLCFYTRPMDQKPRVTRILTSATAKWHRKSGVVEVRTEGAWFQYFKGIDNNDGKKWHSKIKAAIASQSSKL